MYFLKFKYVDVFLLITARIVPGLQRAYVFNSVLDGGEGKFVLYSNFL